MLVYLPAKRWPLIDGKYVKIRSCEVTSDLHFTSMKYLLLISHAAPTGVSSAH